MINFDSKKFKQILDVVSNPPNPKDSKIRDYYADQDYACFNIDFENVDIALRIAGLLGKHATNFTITTCHFLTQTKLIIFNLWFLKLMTQNF
ncbi:hypothetical protein QKW52_21765 [Bacillus sonorensis]|nr:hypothetical protein [Bacillus sonorensis]